MTVVIADTSPLNYLIQIECQELLPVLYGQILIPKAVLRELEHTGTPPAVSNWAKRQPPWVEVRDVRTLADSALEVLGPGEREAIQLAQEEHADLLLIDERLGARIAEQRGLLVTGTLVS